MSFWLSEIPEPLEEQDPKRTRGTGAGVPTHPLFEPSPGKLRGHIGTDP